MNNKQKRNRRKAFKVKCNKLAAKAREIGFHLGWKIPIGASWKSTLFCLLGEDSAPVIEGDLHTVERYIVAYCNLKAFL